MGSSSSKSEASNGKQQSTSNTNDTVSFKNELLGMVLDGLMLFAMYQTSKYLYKQIKPMIDDWDKGQDSQAKLKNRLQRTGRRAFKTSYFENIIAGDIIDPHDIDVTFEDIGGLERQKRDIYDLVVLPLKSPEFFASRGTLLTVPKGILLYGKPGTGKTMLAKAIAKESGAFFIDLKISTIMSKWFGESQKLVQAAFSLAQKLAPCIIFIDEVDSFMGKRGGVSDQTFSSMKTEFLALWDGFTEMTNGDGGGFGVLIMGATNRPGDVDPAFLRRMPRTFEIGLPNKLQREKILRLQLKSERIDDNFDYTKLAVDTMDYSGSDLKELCRAALMIPLREHIDNCRAAEEEAANRQTDEHEETLIYDETAPINALTMRPLSMADFDEARTMVQPTGATAYAYEQSQEEVRPLRQASGSSIDPDIFAAVLAAGLQNLMQQSRNVESAF
ncbi:msp1 family protein [Plasmopara halstedii]|uniref:Msp1 family protein n=1 Tax=Plasmopara halstedii TaxID=4781 RepID=A0A0P1AND4_PLAHL|nr:msp1 family protein [Plasmopara halstedii]CEG42882.1 msp1 family protein [Plasmopara halstedii]|eukprot:XP_024579251.1 msp1 family protein [Plasmopara halstedii]